MPQALKAKVFWKTGAKDRRVNNWIIEIIYSQMKMCLFGYTNNQKMYTLDVLNIF